MSLCAFMVLSKSVKKFFIQHNMYLFLTMHLTFQMVGIGGLLMHRVTLKSKLTQRGELFLVWSLHSEDFYTGRSWKPPLRLAFRLWFYTEFWIGISWIKWEIIHCQEHRSSRSHTLPIFCRALFSLFSSTSQVLPTVAVENRSCLWGQTWYLIET